jgi:hypothetical protein
MHSFLKLRSMPKPPIAALTIMYVFLLSSCSPRDFLTRRLAADLIAASQTFRATQQFQLHTGLISNADYASPEYIALQHHGWISAASAACPAALTPPPCWDISLTPSGVETLQSLVPRADAAKQSFDILAARRELIAVTGIAKQGAVADVEFTWRWHALNEVGAVLYPATTRYRSTASLRRFDDGWRVVQTAPHPNQPLDESLKDAQPVQ